LENKHNIKIPQVITNQTKLPFLRIDPWPVKEKQERDDALVTWIIADQQSFRVVENKEFIAVLNKFDPRYIVPNRHQIKDIVISHFELRRSRIINDLKRIPGKVSLTSDIWTSTLTTEVFLGLSIHYIDDEWILRHFLLDIIPFKVRHTGINIAEHIITVLNEFELMNKILGLTTDNESAMVVCGREIANQIQQDFNSLIFRHYRCSAHILNLGAKQGLELVDKEVVNIRELMGKLKNSNLMCDVLRNLCQVKSIQFRNSARDVETRWNSTYYMLQRFEQMEPALRLLEVEYPVISNLLPDTEGWIKIRVRKKINY
jgi:hypothetical protein